MDWISRMKQMHHRIGFLFLVLFCVCWLGCEPEKEGGTSSSASTDNGAVSNGRPGIVLTASRICRRIIEGDFEQAEQILTGVDVQQRESLQPLHQILASYEQIEAYRTQFRTEQFAEQIAELDKLRSKIGDGPADVNDIGNVVAVVIKAREHAEESKKEQLLADPFVRRIITFAERKGDELETEGHWIDAYSQCYYWLSALDEDNQSWKDQADRLIEKASVELALKDDSCGDTSLERHEGIRALMFQRALDALDFQYVTEPDYNEMAHKALQRCLVLSEVLQRSRDDLAFQVVDAEKHTKWRTGISTLQGDLEDVLKKTSKNKLLLIFDEVLALNKVTLGLPNEIVISQFSEGALSALDPFTMLVWPWNIQDFEKNMRQQFFGIGVEISKATGVLKVSSLLPDTPAYRSGLDAEDIILAVDGESTEEMTIFCAVSKITGPKDTKVTLTVKHAASGKTEDITITRGKIVVPPIRGWQRDADSQWRYMIDEENKFAYIRVTSFTENTVPDVDAILDELEAKGLGGLVLDLRFNSGGYLVSASGLVDLFVEEGVIVTSQPRPGRGWPSEERANKRNTHPNYPLVVLINGQSASASEIVAGALQDPKYNRATLVGSRTYGKGSVQVVVPDRATGSQLKYTMAYYHLPSGQPVKNRYIMEKQGRKDWGIAPDVEIELTLSELQEMIDIQRANEVLAKADHDNNASPMVRHSMEETLKSDPQLALGLLILQAKQIEQSLSLGN
ncbi:MAG: S41 family peptidase [Sedimentisphaerales bacterium]|nr:S41 family peptidase [Sedimentisphaerales bacterium]